MLRDMKNILISGLLILVLFISVDLHAADQVVINNSDSGPGSLRQAITDVGNGEEITFNADYTITLSSQLDIDKSMTITGRGAKNTIIQANANPDTATYGVFAITSGITATLENMTIRHGKSANSGGIYNQGTLTINNCAITDNAATGQGAGGVNSLNSGALTINNSTISENTHTSNDNLSAGGIKADNTGALTLTNCTISGNSSTSMQTPTGGGFYSINADVTFTNCTIANNTAIEGTGGLYAENGTFDIKNTIVANNSSSLVNDFREGVTTFNDNGYNIIETFSIMHSFDVTTITGNQVDLFGTGEATQSLADNDTDNGTQTLALSAGSVAINAGDPTDGANNGVDIPTTDQRGKPRVGNTDIGAYEYIPAPEINLKQASTDIADGGSYDFGTDTDVEFTIENIGDADLTVSTSISITGTNADQFSVHAQPTTPVAPLDNTTFTIRFSPTSTGAKTASIAITNNDSDENPYDLTLNASGTAGGLNYVKVEDAAGGTGAEVTIHSMTADQTFTVYAAGYDQYGNYISDQSVSWTGTGVCSGNLSPATGTSTTFTAVAEGDGTIVIEGYGSVTGDTTGTITVGAILPTVTTTAASSITATTAQSGGNVTYEGSSAITARGVCWSTSANPTIADSYTTNGTGTGGFTSSITGLSPDTTYNVRAYATNTAGTSYGDQVSFTTTTAQAPTVTTQDVTNIVATTATGNGNIIDLGAPDPTAHGVVWNTTGTPTLADSSTYEGAASATGPFTSSMTGLAPNTTYYVRAYATNTADTVYGDQVSFTTDAQAPTEVKESIPHQNAGINDDTRVPNNTSFAVRMEDLNGIDITDTSSIKFTVNDAVNPVYERDLSDGSVRVVKLTGDPDTEVTYLWAVYDRSMEVTYGDYAYDANVNIKVDAKNRTQDWMMQQSYDFNIETLQEHNDAQANLPETSNVDPADPALVPPYNEGSEVNSGNLTGAKIIYANNEPVTPEFGPIGEISVLDTAEEAVGTPMNLQPPTVFNTPVKIFIPCPGYTDVSSLSVYLYNGTNWVLACDTAGVVQPGGEGWMVSGSRVNHNNENPSTIEIQVYHFSGVQSGATTGGGGRPSWEGDAGCFINTAAYGSPVEP